MSWPDPPERLETGMDRPRLTWNRLSRSFEDPVGLDRSGHVRNSLRLHMLNIFILTRGLLIQILRLSQPHHGCVLEPGQDCHVLDLSSWMWVGSSNSRLPWRRQGNC